MVSQVSQGRALKGIVAAPMASLADDGGDVARGASHRNDADRYILAPALDFRGACRAPRFDNAVLDPADRAMIRGFAINRFRGDAALFGEGLTTIETATGWRSVGIVPWFPAAARLPAEDALDLRGGERRQGAALKIGVPVLPGIANFDDLDPLKLEPSVDLSLIRPGQALPGDLDLVILPGSKTTLRDLAALRAEGWDTDILAHRRRGGHVLGLCGGYQMLGRTIRDPQGMEGGGEAADEHGRAPKGG